jgi:hypothetical protein
MVTSHIKRRAQCIPVGRVYNTGIKKSGPSDKYEISGILEISSQI